MDKAMESEHHDAETDAPADTPARGNQPVALASPLDAALRRPNARPAPTAPSLRMSEQLIAPSPTLDPKGIAAIPGYDDATKPYVAIAETAMSEMHEAIAAVIAAREASRRRPDWTEAAAIMAVANHAAALQDRATRVADKVLAQLTTTINGLESMLQGPMESNATSSPVAAEIRAHVKSLSSEGRYAFMMQAVNKKDTRTLGAVLGAPSYLSGLTDDMSATFTRQYNSVKSPEVVQRLDVMKAARAKVEAAGSVFIASAEKAMGARWETANKLKAARASAEQAFVLKAR